MKKKGRGMSAVMHPTGFKGGGDPDQATIRMKVDGTVDLMVGAVDYGQGSKTVLRQIAAEELGIPIDMIALHNFSTDSMPFSTDTAASRVTFIAGNAVINAAKDFKKKAVEFASGLLDVPADELVIEGTKVYKKDDEEKSVDYATLGAASNWGGGYIVGNGAYLHSPGQPIDPETGAIEFAAAMAYCVCVADVEVDTETGQVTVESLKTGYEIGTCVNPLLCEGQFDGGAIMGVGMTLMEDMYPYYPNVNPMQKDFTDYIIPTTVDCPVMENVIVEIPDINGPFGAKGFAEMSSNPQPPAIANAIYDAIGVRIDSLPITPEKILNALAMKN